MKKLTRRDLRQIINESINEGFFDNIKQGFIDTFGQKYHIEFVFPRTPKNIKNRYRHDSNMDYYKEDLYSAIYMTVKNHLGDFLMALNSEGGLNISLQGGVSVQEKKSLHEIGFTLSLNNSAAQHFIENNDAYVSAIQNAYDLGGYAKQKDIPSRNQMVQVASSKRADKSRGKLKAGRLNFLKIFEYMSDLTVPGNQGSYNGLEAMSLYLGQVRRRRGLGVEQEEHGDSSLGGMNIKSQMGTYGTDARQIRDLLRTVNLSLSYDLVALADSLL